MNMKTLRHFANVGLCNDFITAVFITECQDLARLYKCDHVSEVLNQCIIRKCLITLLIIHGIGI